VLRDSNRVTLSATIDAREIQGHEKGFLGVVPQTQAWPENYVDNNRVGPIDAFIQGWQRTWRLMTVSVEMLGKFITGDVSVKNLSGPISIAQGAGLSASYGVVAFLGFLALISVNLGIVNLLPLPMLDGGHLMYFCIEWITGKPVSEAVQEVGFRIGGVLLFMLMATAIFNDILRIT
jgi:regulator of sigma E protease